MRARTIYLIQIGYISTNTREDLGERMQRIPEYVKIFTGQEPLERELKRFYARHGYVMDEVSSGDVRLTKAGSHVRRSHGRHYRWIGMAWPLDCPGDAEKSLIRPDALVLSNRSARHPLTHPVAAGDGHPG